MPTLTVNWEPPPGPWAPEFLDEVQQEVEELLPMVLEARRARRQEIYELLMDMLTSDIKLRRFTGEYPPAVGRDDDIRFSNGDIPAAPLLGVEN